MGLPILPGAISHERWLSARYLESTDRNHLLADMTKEFSRLFGWLSLEEETTSKSSTDVDVRGNTDAITDN